MPKPTKGARLGAGPAHQKLMLGGLAAALIREERVRTTETKAKRVRPVAEKLVSLGKAGTIHARRQALSVIEDRDVVHKLFDDVAPRFTDREGGYTRIVKLGPRKGDAAPMAIIEFVEGAAPPKKSDEPDKRKGRLRRGRAAKDETTKPEGRRTRRRKGPEEAVAAGDSEDQAPDEAATDGAAPQEGSAGPPDEPTMKEVAEEGAAAKDQIKSSDLAGSTDLPASDEHSGEGAQN